MEIFFSVIGTKFAFFILKISVVTPQLLLSIARNIFIYSYFQFNGELSVVWSLYHFRHIGNVSSIIQTKLSDSQNKIKISFVIE